MSRYRIEQVILACSLALIGLAVAAGILLRQLDRPEVWR